MPRAAYDLIRRRIDGKPATFARIVCRSCAAHAECRVDARPPPETIAKTFEREGWSVDRRNANRCFCPDCHPSRKGTLSVTMPATLTTPAPMPSPKLLRQVFAMLEDRFNPETGAFQDGWSDARIACETGASPIFVTKTREDAFGVLRADPDVAALRRSIDDLLSQLSALSAKVDDLDKRRRP